ncbi:MAG: hypothetical protein DSZ03_09160 [Sulfurimonas sp.]|nr:MAG: hypothetical protein DSZ03_09160 [Sulfurimonas sp.]
MLKWLLVIAVVVGIYYFFIKKKPMLKAEKPTKKEQSSELVECTVCGTFCSVSEAFIKERRYYCSQECLDA